MMFTPFCFQKKEVWTSCVIQFSQQRNKDKYYPTQIFLILVPSPTSISFEEWFFILKLLFNNKNSKDRTVYSFVFFEKKNAFLKKLTFRLSLIFFKAIFNLVLYTVYIRQWTTPGTHLSSSCPSTARLVECLSGFWWNFSLVHKIYFLLIKFNTTQFLR